jgi:hypothetical protein
MSEQGHTGSHGACQWVHGSVEMWAQPFGWYGILHTIMAYTSLPGYAGHLSCAIKQGQHILCAYPCRTSWKMQAFVISIYVFGM